MHVSLGFMVHNDHPHPQITVCASLVPRLSFPTHRDPGYEVKYVRVYRALEFMPVYICLQCVTSIVAILQVADGKGILVTTNYEQSTHECATMVDWEV